MIRKELYLIEILHQTTTCGWRRPLTYGCILSKFYIKPQLPLLVLPAQVVVSYRNSTSNHNYWRVISVRISVVSYRNSTSNHNYIVDAYQLDRLYLIEILHQTTTNVLALIAGTLLYLIEILHQTTTRRRGRRLR